MISFDNTPTNSRPHDSDFTVDSYRDLLAVAKQSYAFASYNAIPWGEKFVLWRHDCDFSLNRAHAIAKIESEEGVRSTYFLNPHCEYYNLFELSQFELVKEILEMGHHIGLHFDAAFHNPPNELRLAENVQSEAAILENLFGVRPLVFSFHNPVASHMGCESEAYGGLVNCYSKRFKTEVPYCSDSNGYWRFRRLRDVLSQATDPCLQVLTHPGWWQAGPMAPRQRLFRSTFGRAKATMQLYDDALDQNGRQNMNGALGALQFLKNVDQDTFELCDVLWNREDFPALFFELWRLQKKQTLRICSAVFLSRWNISSVEIDDFFQNLHPETSNSHIMSCVFGNDWKELDPASSKKCGYLWSQLLLGRDTDEKILLEDGCTYLCRSIETMATWAINQQGTSNGLDCDDYNQEKIGPANEVTHECVGEDETRTNKSNLSRWNQFKINVKRKLSD